MAGGVTEQDLRRVLDVVDAVGEPDPDVGVSTPLLQALTALVPSDIISIIDIDPNRATVYLDQEWDGERAVVDDTTSTDEHDPFWRHYASSRSCSYPTRTGDYRSITWTGDFYGQAEWRRTPMYIDVFKPGGADYDLMCCLSPRGTRTPRILFFRNSAFTERDRLVMTLLRPHLVEAWATAGRPAPQPAPSPLTARQTELMRLVAAGWTNAEIASSLFVSPHTVRKHLENIFARLEVTSRTAAVARAFPT
jgi:DNA-binding CsgD family transcriptional regulator